MSLTSDARFMALALSLGRRGLGRVWPNPAVGCVIVKDGRIVGRAHTADGGRPHAETQALAQAGNLAKGADVFVTLEPCSHHGQTPPCAQALIDAGVRRVVVATGDPDTRVAGRGIAMLRAAGIATVIGCCGSAARADNAGFLKVREQGLPFLTLKLATTLDGRIATATGDSKWITGPQARHMVHGMRMRHDAVLVGAGTVRADDPSLNVRGFGAVPQPVRVVASGRADLPLKSKLVTTAQDQPTWVCHAAGISTDALTDAGVTTLPVDGADGGIDPRAMLTALAGQGITRVFCEGGGMLAASLLGAGLVDEVILFQGGAAVGDEGRGSVGPMALSRLADAPRFALNSVRPVGPDVMQVWRPA